MSVAPVTPVVTGTKTGAQLAVVGCEDVDALDEDGLGLGGPAAAAETV